jgi:CDP-diacylglycerol---glycerol-3-phosphate 3-phosphatidyltransferase
VIRTLRWPEFFLFNQRTQNVYREIINPVLNFLIRMKISPNAVTTAGFVLSAVAGLIFSTGNFYLGGWTVALAGTCDILDGQLSRVTGLSSRFGAFYDSCLDRISEAFIFMGLAWYFAGGQALFWSPNAANPESCSPLTVMLIILTITGSFLTSYVKARAEAAGIACNIGRMQRPERFVLLLIASALGSIPGIGILLMKISLGVFALLTGITAIQRIIYVGKILLQEKTASAGQDAGK